MAATHPKYRCTFSHTVNATPLPIVLAAFCAALVDNFCFGTSIAAPVKAFWATELVTMLPLYSSRGDFTVAIGQLVDSYAGTDTNLLTLKAALAARAEQAATFAQSAAGAVYNGQGFAQLLAPLQPTPIYALSASSVWPSLSVACAIVIGVAWYFPRAALAKIGPACSM